MNFFKFNPTIVGLFQHFNLPTYKKRGIYKNLRRD